jgi:hypothetical protein
MRARAAGHSALLLLDVVDVLVATKIPYAVVGALAAALHGSIRATTDADALISLSLLGLGKLERSLRKAGFTTELHRGDESDPIPALLAVTDRFGNRVDLIGGLRGLDPRAFDRVVSVPFQGSVLKVAGREDFIAMKCFAGGPQDLLDAERALRAADAPIDIDLLRRTTRRFGRAAADVLETLLAS